MAVCPSCRRALPAAGRICPHCGTELPGRTRLGSAPNQELEGGFGATLIGAPPLEPAEAPSVGAREVTSEPPIARRFEPQGTDTWFGHVDPRRGEEGAAAEPPRALDLAKPPEATTHRSAKPTPAEEAYFRVRGPAQVRARPVRTKTQRKPMSKLQVLGVSVPWWAVLACIALAGVGGGVLARLIPRAPALKVIGFEVTADGQDQLTVSCGGCPDGSTVRLGQAQATLVGGVAQLVSAGLQVGENRLPLTLEIPGGKRSSVEVTVALAFRVSTDLRGITEVPPYALVVVSAPRGTSVNVGGTLVASEPGVVRSRIDLGSEASGPSPRPLPLHRKVPVRVLGPELERTTHATIAASIVPLVLDGASPKVEGGLVLVLGVTGPGAEVSLVQAGRTLAKARADAQGRFSLRAAGSKPGPALVAASATGRISRQLACQLPAVPK